jgi:hypothetical protein
MAESKCSCRCYDEDASRCARHLTIENELGQSGYAPWRSPKPAARSRFFPVYSEVIRQALDRYCLLPSFHVRNASVCKSQHPMVRAVSGPSLEAIAVKVPMTALVAELVM